MRELYLSALVIAIAASPVSAQIAQPPPRPSRPIFGGGAPPDPSRTRHEVRLDSSILGGYDDNLAQVGQRGLAPTIRPSAYTAVADLSLQYFVGNNTRSLDVAGRGYGNAYRNVGMNPDYGGDLNVAARTDIGRYSSFTFSEALQVAPYYSLSLFGNLQPTATGSTSNLANALFTGRTYISNTSAGINHEWTRRTSTSLRYMYGLRRHEDRNLLDNHTHTGDIRVDRRLGRTFGLRASYNYGDQKLHQAGISSNIETHTMDGGFTMDRQLSRTRRMALSGGGGAHHVHTSGIRAVTQNFWKPNLFGTFTIDVGRSWSATADYRQSSNVLPAPVMGPQSYLAHSVALSAGGYIGPRLELVFDAANSNGVVATGLLASGQTTTGSYKGYTGSGQLRIRITDWWSGIVSYSHYEARLSGSAAAFLQTSPFLHRNSVRVGFAWTAPLYGAGGRLRGRGAGAAGRGRGGE